MKEMKLPCLFCCNYWTYLGKCKGENQDGCCAYDDNEKHFSKQIQLGKIYKYIIRIIK
jgi:hypothetical protein